MAGPVETAEARAKLALARLDQAITTGQAFAFTPIECERINELIGALRDHQSIGTGGNPVEQPCPVCSAPGFRDDPDYTCDVCDNLRFVPTQEGRLILDMVERHFITSIDEELWALNPVPPGESNP